MDPVALSLKTDPAWGAWKQWFCLQWAAECQLHMDFWTSYLILTERLKVVSSIKDRIFQKFNMQNYYFWKETPLL